MADSILVAYATRYGSTQEVAEKIAATLKVLVKFSWLTPVAVELFGGKFDPARLTFPYNLIPALKRMPVNDIRDWEVIYAWAKSLAEKLG